MKTLAFQHGVPTDVVAVVSPYCAMSIIHGRPTQGPQRGPALPCSSAATTVNYIRFVVLSWQQFCVPIFHKGDTSIFRQQYNSFGRITTLNAKGCRRLPATARRNLLSRLQFQVEAKMKAFSWLTGMVRVMRPIRAIGLVGRDGCTSSWSRYLG
jgi:hypothetical protein